jgi:hypothetical protein
MWTLDFDGWFQCRLATDADPFDEKRGADGWTFAFAGEPDLDRTIRFQTPVAQRSHGPAVGVRVKAVSSNGQAVAGHALVGAPIDLVDQPVFEGRDGLIATSAKEPIAPFHLVIAQDGFHLGRLDPLDLTDPNQIRRRQPIRFETRSQTVAQATGITDYPAYRAARKGQLQADLASETDPTRSSALSSRIAELDQGDIREDALGFLVQYSFALQGAAELVDPQGLLAKADLQVPWPIAFWMGGWDADALSGFVRGTLQIPTSTA